MAHITALDRAEGRSKFFLEIFHQHSRIKSTPHLFNCEFYWHIFGFDCLGEKWYASFDMIILDQDEVVCSYDCHCVSEYFSSFGLAKKRAEREKTKVLWATFFCIHIPFPVKRVAWEIYLRCPLRIYLCEFIISIMLRRPDFSVGFGFSYILNFRFNFVSYDVFF